MCCQTGLPIGCEQPLSVPQNQSRKHKNRAAKKQASRRETASRKDAGVGFQLKVLKKR